MAPRLLARKWIRSMRGALLGVSLGLAGAAGALACTVPPHISTQMPESLSLTWDGPGARVAWYDGPTTRYAHGVLGDTVEATQLLAYSDSAVSSCGEHTITLPDELVFEDFAPRLADLDGDGLPEVIVVQSHQRLGAQLAVYRVAAGEAGFDLVATTPFIGRSNRWLAPIGAADFDDDGLIEIAYIDRPHLARTLRVWRFASGALTQIASLDGLTNHRIGEDFISGGVRECGQGPEMITADATWSQIMVTRLSDGELSARSLGPFTASAMQDALACGR